jgi:DNA-binding response OmpR family regulator
MAQRDLQVLIVEDNEDICELYRRLLHGHQTEVTDDGEKACKLLDDQIYDLLILDMHIKTRTGLEVLEHARKNPKYSRTLIMAISADDTLRRPAREMGVDFWMTKPIDIDRLYGFLQGVARN